MNEHKFDGLSFRDLLDGTHDDDLEEFYDSYVEKFKDIPDPVTPELDARMQKMFDDMRREEAHQHIRKIAKVATVAVLCVGIGCASITQTEAWQAAIANLRIIFSDSPRTSVCEHDSFPEVPDGVPFPITPKGFSVESVDVSDDIVKITYTGQLTEFTFTAYDEKREIPDGFTMAVDINGSVGAITKHGKSYTISWNAYKHSFELSGKVDVNTLIDIARSVN